jgi:hypothetical protein
VLDETTLLGMNIEITDYEWLSVFGLKKRCTVGDLLKKLSTNDPIIQQILIKGNLSSRITDSLDTDLSPESIKRTFQRLARCLEQNQMFVP